MKKKIHPIEQEVNEIRLRMYEETKHMTTAEFCRFVYEEVEPIIKEYGMKVVSKSDLIKPVSE
jgi:hypothetical protein